MVGLSDIQNASARIRDHVIRTPLIYSPTFSSMSGANVYLKLENLQKAGSFKVRGATNKILSNRDAIGERGVIAASAGNHAQGVAVAAQQAGIPATIVMPRTVSITKEKATKGYGADVILWGDSLEESIEHAQKLAAEGMTFIHPFDDPHIIAGQGTIALEILDDLPETDCIIVPVGGGGLISGIALGAKSIRPDIRIIGAEAVSCPAGCRACERGEPVKVSSAFSIADGIMVQELGKLPFSIIRDHVETVVALSEDEIARAMLLLLERKKVLAEGAGAVPLAAMLNGGIALPEGSNVVLVISGGNIDSPLLDRIIRKGMLSRGRIMKCTVCIEDTPGTLAGLLGVIAECRGNILHIYHARAERDLPIQVIRVELEIETRGSEHNLAIRNAVKGAGYEIEVK